MSIVQYEETDDSVKTKSIRFESANDGKLIEMWRVSIQSGELIRINPNRGSPISNRPPHMSRRYNSFISCIIFLYTRHHSYGMTSFYGE